MGVWIATVLMLYPLCRWFANVKETRREAVSAFCKCTEGWLLLLRFTVDRRSVMQPERYLTLKGYNRRAIISGLCAWYEELCGGT